VQPLLENAIGHGVENLEGGGTVTVEGSEADGHILLRVRNPLPLDGAPGRGGHGIALDNIRERLELLFGAGSAMKSGREGDEFVVELRFPATLTPPELAG
jgi:two-component system sensor histidine kinase AlgZ